MNGRICRFCGCDDDHACEMLDGSPCSWAAPDLCSACAEGAELALLAENTRRVEIYSDAEASAFIADARRARTGAALIAIAFCVMGAAVAALPWWRAL